VRERQRKRDVDRERKGVSACRERDSGHETERMRKLVFAQRIIPGAYPCEKNDAGMIILKSSPNREMYSIRVLV